MLNAKLIVVGGDAKTQEVSLRLPATVGRSKSATLTVPHALVSRVHCEITERNGVLVVKDLQSMNGTYVNNLRIKGEQPLLPGELLTLGNITFRADYGAEPMNESPSERSHLPSTTTGHPASGVGSHLVSRPSTAQKLNPNHFSSAGDPNLVAGANDRTLSAEDLAAKDRIAKSTDNKSTDNLASRMNETAAKPAALALPSISKSPPPVVGTPPAASKKVGIAGNSLDKSSSSASDSTIDFEEIGIGSPEKSISLSALGDLPSMRPQVSFIDNLGVSDPKSIVDLDPETIQLDIGEKSKSDDSVDINALSSFIKKIK